MSLGDASPMTRGRGRGFTIAHREQEEMFFVVSGSPVLVIDGEDHPARPGTFARLDPARRRTVRNDGSATSSVLIVSAPTTSGYEPMAWA